MSTLKVNKIRDNSGSTDAIVLDPSGGAVLAGVTTVSAVKVGSGVTISSDGDVFTTGITTSSSVIVGSGVTITESGIEASGIGITCANLNRSQIGGRRNIVINGAMVVAQRGTSSTTSGYSTVDRFRNIHENTDEAPTQERASVSPSTETPYRLGFTKSYKITNGNQTGGAAANSTCVVDYRIESQDLRHCSWNFKDSTENIVLSYWVKASVAQTYYVRIFTGDNPNQAYTFGYALSANTWTKIVHKIPGYINIVFDDDNGLGMIIRWYQYRGTDYTDNSVTLNEWRSHNSAQNTPDQTTTWYTTNDATWEITGVQLEAGDEATNFEHRSHGDELTLCQRYYQSGYHRTRLGGRSSDTVSEFTHYFKGTMRTQPTVTTANTLGTLDSVTFANMNNGGCYLDFTNDSSLNFAATVNADAEL